MYYKNELYEDNEDLLPCAQEYNNDNEEQDDDYKVYITDTDGIESESEDGIMPEDEDDDHTVIDRECLNRTTTTRSGRVLIPLSRL